MFRSAVLFLIYPLCATSETVHTRLNWNREKELTEFDKRDVLSDTWETMAQNGNQDGVRDRFHKMLGAKQKTAIEEYLRAHQGEFPRAYEAIFGEEN